MADNKGFEDERTDVENVEVKPIEDSETNQKIYNENETLGLLYSLEDTPPWYMCILLGAQQYMTMIGSTIVIPLSLIPHLCIAEDDPAKAAIVSTILFVSGMVTLFQSTFGIRLPIVQGGTFGILVPTIVILKSTYTACKEIDLSVLSEEERRELWQERMREIQGAIIVASLFQIFIGFSGLIGQMLKWLTPLAITPTIALIGLSLFSVAADMAGTHWGISIFTMVLMIIFSQYLRNIKVPVPYYSRSGGCRFTFVPVFNLFPIILSILLAWGLCAILTATDSFSKHSAAKTTSNIIIIEKAPWFRFPYPGQWGVPTVTAASVFGILAGVISSMIESIGDYYACARLCGAPPPPTHAMNRGIFMEGIGCLLAGLWGSGNGTTSYSENIGSIGVTKIGSRRVVQFGGIIMILFGVIGKFGAVFVTIPAPVVGGMFCIMFSIITAVGLSSLQFVNLNSSRNLFILGFSMFMGIAISDWTSKEANRESLKIGSVVFDQIVAVLLQTSMFVGGAIGFILDNTVPGTDEERGLDKWNQMVNPNDNQDVNIESSSYNSYDLPFGMELIKRAKWTKYIPISPTFKGWGSLLMKFKKRS